MNDREVQIFVKTVKHGTITVALKTSDKVRSLKRCIENCTGIPWNCQRLVGNGRQLRDDLTVEAEGVGDATTLELLMEVKGGGKGDQRIPHWPAGSERVSEPRMQELRDAWEQEAGSTGNNTKLIGVRGKVCGAGHRSVVVATINTRGQLTPNIRAADGVGGNRTAQSKWEAVLDWTTVNRPDILILTEASLSPPQLETLRQDLRERRVNQKRDRVGKSDSDAPATRLAPTEALGDYVLSANTTMDPATGGPIAGRGVAVLISRRMHQRLDPLHKTPENVGRGRGLHLRFLQGGGKISHVIGMHAVPSNTDQPDSNVRAADPQYEDNERAEIESYLRAHMSAARTAHEPTLVIGDLNSAVRHMDRVRTPTKGSAAFGLLPGDRHSDSVAHICQQEGLTDLWTLKHPDLLVMTHKHSSGESMSRIDSAWGTPEWTTAVAGALVLPPLHYTHESAAKPDHRPVAFVVESGILRPDDTKVTPDVKLVRAFERTPAADSPKWKEYAAILGDDKGTSHAAASQNAISQEVERLTAECHEPRHPIEAREAMEKLLRIEIAKLLTLHSRLHALAAERVFEKDPPSGNIPQVSGAGFGGPDTGEGEKDEDEEEEKKNDIREPAPPGPAMGTVGDAHFRLLGRLGWSPRDTGRPDMETTYGTLWNQAHHLRQAQPASGAPDGALINHRTADKLREIQREAAILGITGLPSRPREQVARKRRKRRNPHCPENTNTGSDKYNPSEWVRWIEITANTHVVEFLAQRQQQHGARRYGQDQSRIALHEAALDNDAAEIFAAIQPQKRQEIFGEVALEGGALSSEIHDLGAATHKYMRSITADSSTTTAAWDPAVGATPQAGHPGRQELHLKQPLGADRAAHSAEIERRATEAIGPMGQLTSDWYWKGEQPLDPIADGCTGNDCRGCTGCCTWDWAWEKSYKGPPETAEMARAQAEKERRHARDQRVQQHKVEGQSIPADTTLLTWKQAITSNRSTGTGRTQTHVSTKVLHDEEHESIRSAYAPVADPDRRLKTAWERKLYAPVTITELDRMLKSKKGDSAPGPTELQYIHLRKAPACTKRMLCAYVQAMLLTEVKWDSRAVHSTLVFIRKKAGVTLRSFRPITLQQALTKVVTGIMAKRIASVVESGSGALDVLQQGFVPGGSVGTPIQILNGILEHAKAERAKKNGRGEVHVCFYDFSNAYTTVPPWAVEVAMRRLHMPEAVISRMVTLMQEQRAAVRTSKGMTEDFALGGGLPQGDPCSPILWAIVMDPLMTRMRELQRKDIGYTLSWKEECCHFQTQRHRSETAAKVEAQGGAQVRIDPATESAHWSRKKVMNPLSRTRSAPERVARAAAIKDREAPEQRTLTATALAFADDLCGMASSSTHMQKISYEIGLLSSFVSLKMEPTKVVYLACDAYGKPISTQLQAPALQARKVGPGYTFSPKVVIANALATGSAELHSPENTARYLGVHFNLALDWTVTVGHLKAKMANLMANLRHAGASYLAIDATIQSVVASRTAFAAQVAVIPRTVMTTWEGRLAQSILLDLELSTDAAWSEKRHGLFAATAGGGGGFQSIEGTVNASMVMEYMVRRCSPGTEVCDMAEWQDWKWRQSKREQELQQADMRAHAMATGEVPAPQRGSGMGPAAHVGLLSAEQVEEVLREAEGATKARRTQSAQTAAAI
jgi:hypothetical protein